MSNDDPLKMEHFSEPVASRLEFTIRVWVNFRTACYVIIASLAIGMIGYHEWVGLAWDDAFLNAAMILSGMGPMAPCTTLAGKLFAGTYALYSGLVVVMTAGLILAPVAHRIMHKLHVDCE
jgi:hypothetical protein